MATVTLTFPSGSNFSAQVGDTAYYTNPTDDDGGFTTANNIVAMGFITTITDIGDGTYQVVCEIESTTVLPTADSFILFSKENTVNTTSLLGYYGEVEFRNDSTEKAELFATACEVVESSK